VNKARIWWIFAIMMLGILLGIEVLVRVAGVADFPLYELSTETGYQLKSNQSGEFMKKNKWYVNAEGFNNDSPFDGGRPYTLLVGDSIVYGGNPVDYKDRIGSQLANSLDQNVWVAAVGGWSLYSELAYIEKRDLAVRNARNIVIVYDNGDLDGISKWGGNSFIRRKSQPLRHGMQPGAIYFQNLA